MLLTQRQGGYGDDEQKYGIGLALLTVVLLAGCGTQQSTQNKATSQSTSSQSNSTKSVTAKTKVSLAAAIKKFQQQYPDASVTSIELEDQLGRPVYTLEGVGGTRNMNYNSMGEPGRSSVSSLRCWIKMIKLTLRVTG